MKNSSYFEQRALSCIERTEKILETLPYFVTDFFIGIENITSPLTRLNYAYDLRVFFDFLSKKRFKGKNIDEITLKDINMLEAEDIEYYLSYISNYEINGKKERCTERGKARKLASLRSFFKYNYNKGKLSENVASKVAMPKLHDKEIIRLETDGATNEVIGLINTVESGNGLSKKQQDFHNKTKVRDVAIVTLFLGTGIRISELVGINLEDVDFLRNSFVVTRKGGNRTILYFNEEVKAALEEYYNERNTNPLVSDKENALFLSLQNKRITTRAVQQLVKKYAQIVTPLKKITPHKLRSTFGTNLYKETNDIYIVANYLGHNDVNTTKKHYAAISEDLKKKAVKHVKLRDNDIEDD